jgi:predicted esterase
MSTTSSTFTNTPTVIQPTTKHHASVIFLHGLGGTGMNYEMLVRPIAPAFPHVKIILPSA